MELPCGCKMWKEAQTLYIIPCSLKCEYYKYAVMESKKQGNIIVKR